MSGTCRRHAEIRYIYIYILYIYIYNLMGNLNWRDQPDLGVDGRRTDLKRYKRPHHSGPTSTSSWPDDLASTSKIISRLWWVVANAFRFDWINVCQAKLKAQWATEVPCASVTKAGNLSYTVMIVKWTLYPSDKGRWSRQALQERITRLAEHP
jgi:hypothetical protein